MATITHSFASVCPFGGVRCSCTKTWAPKALTPSGFTKHCNHEDCSPSSTGVVQLAETAFRSLATFDLALPDDRRLANLSSYLDPALFNGVFCEECKKVLSVEGDSKRLKCTVVTHTHKRYNCIRKVLANDRYLLLTEDNFTESFCNIYKVIRERVGTELEIGAVPEELRPLIVRAAADVIGTNVLPEIFNCPPPAQQDELPLSWPEDDDQFEAELLGGLSGSVKMEANSSSTEARKAFYKLQGLADKNAPNHGRIIHWMEDLGYARLAATMDDDYGKMSRALLTLLRAPESMMEMKLNDASEDLFDFACDNVLPLVSPIVKTSIMLVASGNVNQKLGKMQQAMAQKGVIADDFNAIAEIFMSDSDMTTIGSRSLQVPEEATRKKYLKLFQQFILLAFRRCISMRNRPKYFNSGMRVALTGDKANTRMAVAQILFTAIGFPGKGPAAADTIAIKLSVVDYFLMAKGIRGTNLLVAPSGEVQPEIFNHYSPTDARTAGNAVLFGSRICWCFAKMAVDQSDAPDSALVQRMGMPMDFGGLSRIRMLTESIRICKKAADEMTGLGNEKARVFQKNGVDAVRHADVVLTQPMFQGAVSRLKTDIEDFIRDLIQTIRDNDIGTATIGSHLSLKDNDHYAAFLHALLAEPIEIVASGQIMTIQYNVVDGPVVYASAIGFNVVLEGADVGAGAGSVDVRSDAIASKLFDILQRDVGLRKRVLQSIKAITPKVAALVSLVTRGSPRGEELKRLNCGTSNLAAAEIKTDFQPHGLAETNDQLVLCYSKTYMKYSYGNKRDTPIQMLPEESGRLVALFIGLSKPLMGRIHLANAGNKITAAIVITRLTNFLDPDTLEMAEVDGIPEARENSLGVPSNSLGEAIYRQCRAALLAEMSMTEEKNSIPRVIPRHAATAMGHSQKTHEGEYMELSDVFPDRCQISKSQASNELLLDMQHHEWLGDSGWLSRAGNHSATLSGETGSPLDLPPWRLFRVPDEFESLGILRFGGSINFLPRPIQVLQVRENISATRDTLTVLPCGGGKSVELWILPAYALLCHISALDEGGQIDFITKHLVALRENTKDDLARALAASILQDTAVQKAIAFAKADVSEKPSRNLINVVFVPTIPLKESLLAELNALHLIRAEDWNSDTRSRVKSAMASRLKGGVQKGHSSNFQILVCTSQFGCGDESREDLEKYMKEGQVGKLFADECDAAVVDRNWREDMIRFGKVKRIMVPMGGLSGTVSMDLQKETLICLSSRAGRQTIEARIKASTVSSQGLTGTDVQNELIDSYGIIRAKCSIPPHLRHAVLKVKGERFSLETWLCSLICTLFRREGKRAIQVILPTRHCVDVMKIQMKSYLETNQNNSNIKVLSFQGGDDAQSFNASWTSTPKEGDLLLAFTTTAAARGVNAPLCDCVLLINLEYGLSMAVQGAHRAGRRGQASDVIFVDAKGTSLSGRKRSREDDDVFRSNLEAANVNIHDPAVSRALSNVPLQKYITSNTCRRLLLHQEMDNGSKASLVEATNGCCDLCDNTWAKKLQSYSDAAMSEAKEATDGSTDNNPAQHEARTIQHIEQQTLNREVEDAVVRFFKTQRDRSTWRNYSNDMEGACDFELGTFLGASPTSQAPAKICPDCGDYRSGCDRHGCCSKDAVWGQLMRKNCAVSRDILDNSDSNQGILNRPILLKGLFFFALRHEEGYASAKAHYIGSDYPPRIPFSWDDNPGTVSERSNGFAAAVKWASIPNNNISFWDAVRKSIDVAPISNRL